MEDIVQLTSLITGKFRFSDVVGNELRQIIALALVKDPQGNSSLRYVVDNGTGAPELLPLDSQVIRHLDC